MSVEPGKWGVIYNPKAGTRKVQKRWKEIKEYMDSKGVNYDYVQSEGFGSVERLAKILANNGYRTIVIVGGDGALNDAAKERGCNLVALGHNRDDVIETFFMSLLYESRLNTFGPVTYLGRKDVTVIRPMVFLPEKQALSIATRLELPIRKPNCPAAGHTKREEMKQVMRFFTGLIPDAEERIMNAIADTEKYGMWDNLRLPPRDVLDIVSSPKAPRFCRECPNNANKSDDNGEDE